MTCAQSWKVGARDNGNFCRTSFTHNCTLTAIESIKVNLLDDVAHITTLDETPAPSSLFRAAVLTDYEVAELDAECCPSACARVNIHGTPFAHIVEDAEAFHSVKPPTTYTRAASRDALADLLQARWGSVDLYGDRTVQPTTASVKQRRMDRSVQTADTPATMYPLVEALTTMSQPASTANSPVIIASVLPASQPVAGASSSREKLKSKKRVGFR